MQGKEAVVAQVCEQAVKRPPNKLLIVDRDIELAPLWLKDARDYYPVILANRSQLSRFLNWAPGITSQGAVRQYLRQRIDSRQPGNRWYKIVYRGQICGTFGIKWIVDGVAEVGYWLASRVQGRGVIARILQSIAPFLHQECSVHTLEFQCLSHNLASIRVAERFGAREHRVVEFYRVVDGHPRALYIYRGPTA